MIPVGVLLGVDVHVLSTETVGDLVFGNLVGLDAVNGTAAIGGFGVGSLRLGLCVDAGSHVDVNVLVVFCCWSCLLDVYGKGD